MVPLSLLFPAAMKTQRLFDSGVRHSIQLDSQSRLFLTDAPLKEASYIPRVENSYLPFSTVFKLV